MGNLAGVRCDGPNCTTVLYWDPDRMKEHADELPDAAFRIISFVPFAGGAKVFCGKFCTLEFLKTYENPKSPAELAREQAAKVTPIDKNKPFPPADLPESGDPFPAAPDQGDPVA